MARFNLSDYEPVEARLERFWKDHPDGAVRTELCPANDGEWVVLANVFKHRDHPAPDGTGYAHEVVGDGMVNTTSALENCETSAIGRALANIGYAPKGSRPSREEMEKVERRNAKEQEAPEWWSNFKSAAKQADIQQGQLSEVLGAPVTMKNVAAWMENAGEDAAGLLSRALLKEVDA